MAVITPCNWCGSDVVTTRKPSNPLCSLSCRRLSRAYALGPRLCTHCGITFYSDKPEARFCGRPCWLTWYNQNEQTHGAKGTSKAAAVVAEKYRGTGTKGYIKENGRHQHRVVAERKLGRPLQPGEIVHHVDGDKHNNHPDNLEVMTQAEHARLHHMKGHSTHTHGPKDGRH